jgi:hypothetical protein
MKKTGGRITPELPADFSGIANPYLWPSYFSIQRQGD